MVVVMSPDATADRLAAVVARVEDAGGSAFVSRGVTARSSGWSATSSGSTALNLRALPGVVDVHPDLRCPTSWSAASTTATGPRSMSARPGCRSVRRRSR